MHDPLRHHGDAEARDGLLDFAVNVYPGPRPEWLDDALRRSLDDVGCYPDPAGASAALAAHLGLPADEVLLTAGAAEAFTLLARWRPWRRPVVVHPQFTEPHAALEQAGRTVTPVVLSSGLDGPSSADAVLDGPSSPHPYALDPGRVPADADLVVVGNPTNPTGVLHPANVVRALLRPGRTVVVDEAFMDCVPGERESLLRARTSGLVVVRSLTKHWGIPGIRAGYLTADAATVRGLRALQTPWSVGTTAIAAVAACATDTAAAESRRRADQIAAWRAELSAALTDLGIPHVPSAASFVLARVGPGVHSALRDAGIAVRRADTFPGLDSAWVRIAVRPPDQTALLHNAVTTVIGPSGGRPSR